MTELMKVTEYLRSYPDLASYPVKPDDDTLNGCRKWRIKRLKVNVTWREACDLAEKDAISTVEVKKHLETLRALVQELSGSQEGKHVVDGNSVFLLQQFLDQKNASIRDRALLTEVFGSALTRTIIHRAQKIVGEITSLLPSYSQECLTTGKRNVRLLPERFGSKFDVLDCSQNSTRELESLRKLKTAENDEDDADEGSNVSSSSVISSSVKPEHEHKASTNNSSPIKSKCKSAMEEEEIEVPRSNGLEPTNVKYFENLQYEERNIYYTEPLLMKKQQVPKSRLFSVDQKVFEDVPTFNSIESTVFDAAYTTSDNLLIFVPPDVRKVCMSLLPILRVVRQHTDSKGDIFKHRFKVVYIVSRKCLFHSVSEELKKRLKRMGLSVRVCTGDSRVSRETIHKAQVLVTSPEKWDIITRNCKGDELLLDSLKLIIFDELLLLDGNRGPVVEALVARTLQLMKPSRNVVRIIGFSTPVKNYLDLASFLHVNPETGLFLFDLSLLQLPFTQSILGVKKLQSDSIWNSIVNTSYDIVIRELKRKKQVMLFVPEQLEVVETARMFRSLARDYNELYLFKPRHCFGVRVEADRIDDNEVADFILHGLVIRHPSTDCIWETLMRYYEKDIFKLLICSVPYAWEMQMCADVVIVQGTDIYDGKVESFVNLNVVDVLKIFGKSVRSKSGRFGKGVIVTPHEKLEHYYAAIMNKVSVKSTFLKHLADTLLAEISLGTVTNIEEAVDWYGCTYCAVEMRNTGQQNNTNECLTSNTDQAREVVRSAAILLQRERLITVHQQTTSFSITDLGQIACYFFIRYGTMGILQEYLKSDMSFADVFTVLSNCKEFIHVKIHQFQCDELEELSNRCHYAMDERNKYWKIAVLIQSHISRICLKSPSLLQDQIYIIENAVRICRATFESSLLKNNAAVAVSFLRFAQMLEQQVWDNQTPLRQFPTLDTATLESIEVEEISVDRLRKMEVPSIARILQDESMADTVKKCVEEFPFITVKGSVSPVVENLFKINISYTIDFTWNNAVHGKHSQYFWIWVEDKETNYLYEYDKVQVSKEQVARKEELTHMLVVSNRLVNCQVVVASDQWMGCSKTCKLPFHDVVLPLVEPHFTELLDLAPLPVSSLRNREFEGMYEFSHFNPIQTQVFHCLYYSDDNVLLAAPSGSGKIVAAELAILRVFREHPCGKVLYISPVTEAVQKRLKDWKNSFEANLGRKVCELPVETELAVKTMRSASVLVSSPETWSALCKRKQVTDMLNSVKLIIIGELHLLYKTRGAFVEETLICATKAAGSFNQRLRVVGLSTTLAFFRDMAEWLCADSTFNFCHDSRPVPLNMELNMVHDPFYCSRMSSMNRLIFEKIRKHALSKPVLVFVPNIPQVFLTAVALLGLINLLPENDYKQWLHLDLNHSDHALQEVKNQNLKRSLQFGIAFWHPDVCEEDLSALTNLYFLDKIQVFITTTDQVWKVDLQAYLVIVKGIECYDKKTRCSSDSVQVSDLIETISKAGRYSVDDSAMHLVFLHHKRRKLYKLLLHCPLPVESSLLQMLPELLCGRIASGEAQTMENVLEHLNHTYMFRRLTRNPCYYDLIPVGTVKVLHTEMTRMIHQVIKKLVKFHCVGVEKVSQRIEPNMTGKVASLNSVNHSSIKTFCDTLKPDMPMEEMLKCVCCSGEFRQLVRKIPESILSFVDQLPLKFDNSQMDSAETIVNVLLQAHLSRIKLPACYRAYAKVVVEKTFKILQVLISIAAGKGWLAATLRLQQLQQMVIQGQWLQESPILVLPNLQVHHLNLLSVNKSQNASLVQLMSSFHKKHLDIHSLLKDKMAASAIRELVKVLQSLPVLRVQLALYESKGYNRYFEHSISFLHIDRHLRVRANMEYTLVIQLARLNPPLESLVAFAPCFPQPKEEAWYLVLGCADKDLLLAMKRVSFIQNESFHMLSFIAPKEEGHTVLTLYVMSDCYLGLDQQYDIHLEVMRPYFQGRVFQSSLRGRNRYNRFTSFQKVKEKEEESWEEEESWD